MKRRHLALCLLAALLLPAPLLLLQPGGAIPVAAKPASPAAARAAQTEAEILRQFVTTMSAWETASGLEGDRLEELLRDAITDQNAEAILRAVPPRFHGTYVGNLLLARWAAQDRGDALQWLAGQARPTLFEVNAVTKNWSVQDSESLKRYVNTLPPSSWKNLVLESTGRDALANQDPELAFSLLQGMDECLSRIPLLANAAQQWARWDARSAIEQINRLPDPATREPLILAVASGYALVNPNAAADWLRRSFTDGATLDRGLAGVMQAWTSDGDPALGAEWITNLAAGPTRDHALRALIAAWSEESAETLQDWLSSLPEGSVRAQADAALGSLAAMR